MGKKKTNNRNNIEFFDSLYINNATFQDYLDRFKKIALSIFEWVNLPSSMNAMWLEKSLYYHGQAALLKDKNYGFINTKCCSAGDVNIYGLPSRLNCYAYNYNTTRNLYTGINNLTSNDLEYNECILVQNNWDRLPTANSMELFAYRLYEAEQTAMININAQKTPILILINEHQRLTLENLYSQYQGNKPKIFGDKDNLQGDEIRAIKTDAPFIADKIMDYKKEIWNEALTYLRY